MTTPPFTPQDPDALPDPPFSPAGTPRPETASAGGKSGAASSTADAVWTYRGYTLRASEFNTAMVHFFRAEVQRANIWRQRLDATTNWAVVTTGAVISVAFTQVESIHVVILLNLILVSMFLSIEARRYRYYELWSSRVRLMETDFFAAMLVPPFHPSPDWAEALAENLLHPQFPISNWEAVGRRLRRNYVWIYCVLLIAWFSRLWFQPWPAINLGEIVERASIGPINGLWVIGLVFAFYGFLIILGIATIGLQQAAGEILPRYGAVGEGLASTLAAAAEHTPGVRAWFRPARHRQQLLTLIISEKSKEVAEKILQDMHRGVTSLQGTGMYTGQPHPILMVALTVTEIPQLKSLVHGEDPKAFVVVTPAQAVFGGGFIPLGEK